MPRASAGEHHKGFQQVRRSSAHFHFVRQRASLYRWLASESLAWSFFYASSYPECTGAHDNRPLTDEADGGWWRIWGGADVGANIFRGRPGDGGVCGTHSSGRTRSWYARPWPQFPSVATTNRERMCDTVSGLQVDTHSHLSSFSDWCLCFFLLPRKRKILQLWIGLKSTRMLLFLQFFLYADFDHYNKYSFINMISAFLYFTLDHKTILK